LGCELDGDTIDDPDQDRWAGTLSGNWDQTPSNSDASDDTKGTSKKIKKPVISISEATKLLPADALEYIRSQFKSDIQQVRTYSPSAAVKH